MVGNLELDSQSEATDSTRFLGEASEVRLVRSKLVGLPKED